MPSFARSSFRPSPLATRLRDMVKNITDFGAFVDLQGMDGLASYHRYELGPYFPSFSEMLRIGQTRRGSDSRSRPRQGACFPWSQADDRQSHGRTSKPVSQWEPRSTGKVTKLLPYGAFIEIEKGRRRSRARFRAFLGQAHHASQRCSRARPGNHRRGAGNQYRRAEDFPRGSPARSPNPWSEIEARYPIGKEIKGEVRNLTAYGAFVGLEEGIDGMIHVSDLSWTRKINHPSAKCSRRARKWKQWCFRSTRKTSVFPSESSSLITTHGPTSTPSSRWATRSRERLPRSLQLRSFRQPRRRHRRSHPHFTAQRRSRRARQGHPQGGRRGGSPRYQGR